MYIFWKKIITEIGCKSWIFHPVICPSPTLLCFMFKLLCNWLLLSQLSKGKNISFFQTLDNTATKLIDDNHYDSENIAAIRDGVCLKARASAWLSTGSGIILWVCWQGLSMNLLCLYLPLLSIYLCFSQLLARRDALRDRAATRRRMLEDSLILQQLFQDSDDLKNWINKKKKLTDDEDYKVGN